MTEVTMFSITVFEGDFNLLKLTANATISFQFASGN